MLAVPFHPHMLQGMPTSTAKVVKEQLQQIIAEEKALRARLQGVTALAWKVSPALTAW